MASVFMTLGSVMDGMTVQTVQMNMTVFLHHVKTKVYGIVAMANVSQRAMFVMAQVNLAMPAGVLTVQMAQTRL